MTGALWPMAIYDTKACQIIHLGLYRNEADVWQVYLGWPTQDEIDHAKSSGLRAISITVQYDPPK